MGEKVAILGIGMTEIDNGESHKKLEEMVFEASYKALQNASLSRDEIESVVIAGNDELDGLSISSMLLSAPAGAYLKDEIKVTDEGIYAILLASMRLLSGVFDLSLAVSWCKTSEAPVSNVMKMKWDPFFHREFGLNDVTATGLMANVYKSKYSLAEEIPAKVVVKNRKNGAKNPRAHLRSPITLDQVMASPFVSWPLKKLEFAPLSDGACALVLASERKVKELRRDPVWIKGFGWATDSYYPGEKNLSELSSLEIAARKAYEMAGIRNPLTDIDVAEIYDLSAYHELLAYEALGICKKGRAANLLNEGVTEISGKFPVNRSGGLLSSNPYFASGMVRVAEAFLQVKGAAGPIQIPGTKNALAHGSCGFMGQGNAVIILGY